MSKKSKERARQKAEKTKNYQLPEKFQNIGITKFQGKQFINIAMPIILLVLIIFTFVLNVEAVERFYISVIATVSLSAMLIIGLTIYKIIIDSKSANKEYNIFHETIIAKDNNVVTFTNDYGKERIVKSSEFETAKVGDEYYVVYWKNNDGKCTKVWQSITKEAFLDDKTEFNVLKSKGYRFPEKDIWSFVKHKWLLIILDKTLEGLYWFFMTLAILFILSGKYVGLSSAFTILFVFIQIIKTADAIQNNISEKCEQLVNGQYLVIHEKIVKKTFNKVFLENDVGNIRTVNKFNFKNIKFTTGCVGDEFYTAYIGEFEEKDDLRSSWKTIAKKQFETNI